MAPVDVGDSAIAWPRVTGLPPSADLTAFVPPGDGCHAAPIKHRVDPAHRGEREAGYPDAWPTHLTWAGLLLPTLVFVG